jgi:hypothetical protein
MKSNFGLLISTSWRKFSINTHRIIFIALPANPYEIVASNFIYQKLPNFRQFCRKYIFYSPLNDIHQNIPKIVQAREPGAKVPFWLFSNNGV